VSLQTSVLGSCPLSPAGEEGEIEKRVVLVPGDVVVITGIPKGFLVLRKVACKNQGTQHNPNL